MALVSAAEYANSEPAKSAYAAAMAYQAAHPSTSSAMPQANDPGSAAYRPPQQSSGSSVTLNGSQFHDWGTANWNNMSQAQRETWNSAGRNFAELDDPDYLKKMQTTPVAYSPPQQSANTPNMPSSYSPTGANMGNNNYQISSTPTPAQTPAFAVKTPEQISAEAKARTDALLAKQTTIAGQTKQGFQTAFDRLAVTTKDDRTLQDSAFQRNTNPFSGGTDYKAAMIGRERETTDRQAQQDLQSRLANVDLSLADYANATEAQRMQMETDMTNAERAYGLQVDQLALQRQGQQNSQYNADRSFNYGVSRDQVGDSRYNDTTNYNRGRDSLTDSRYNDTTSYNRGQDQIKNNQTQSQIDLNLRKQHIEEANYYSEKYGIPVEPKDDFQLVIDQVAGKQTVAQQTAAQKAEEAKRSEAWKRVDQFGSVQSKADADLLGVPVGTQSQKAKEAALDNAYKNRTASNTESNQLFNQQLQTAKLQLDQQESGTKKDETIAKLLDSSPFVRKAYDENDKVTGTTVSDKQGMADSIISLGLPTSETQKWFNRYGIDYRSLGN